MKNKNKKPPLIILEKGATTKSGTPLTELVNTANKRFEYQNKTGDRAVTVGTVTVKTTDDLLNYLSNDAVCLLLNLICLSFSQKTPPVQITAEDIKAHKYINGAVWYKLKDYAHECGYDVFSPNKKRAKQEYDKFRKVRDKALSELNSLNISWVGTGKDKNDYSNRKLIIEEGRLHGWYYAVIHADVLGTLNENNFITVLPTTLYKIGIGKRQVKLLHKLSTHYNIANNKKLGTHNILKITTLLACTELPTIEHLENTNNRNYDGRILQPFYNYLNSFTKDYTTPDGKKTNPDGALLLWELCFSNKKFEKDGRNIADLSPKEIINEGYIHFEMTSNIYHTLEEYNKNSKLYTNTEDQD